MLILVERAISQLSHQCFRRELLGDCKKTQFFFYSAAIPSKLFQEKASLAGRDPFFPGIQDSILSINSEKSQQSTLVQNDQKKLLPRYFQRLDLFVKRLSIQNYKTMLITDTDYFSLYLSQNERANQVIGLVKTGVIQIIGNGLKDIRANLLQWHTIALNFQRQSETLSKFNLSSHNFVVNQDSVQFTQTYLALALDAGLVAVIDTHSKVQKKVKIDSQQMIFLTYEQGLEPQDRLTVLFPSCSQQLSRQLKNKLQRELTKSKGQRIFLYKANNLNSYIQQFVRMNECLGAKFYKFNFSNLIGKFAQLPSLPFQSQPLTSFAPLHTVLAAERPGLMRVMRVMQQMLKTLGSRLVIRQQLAQIQNNLLRFAEDVRYSNFRYTESDFMKLKSTFQLALKEKDNSICDFSEVVCTVPSIVQSMIVRPMASSVGSQEQMLIFKHSFSEKINTVQKSGQSFCLCQNCDCFFLIERKVLPSQDISLIKSDTQFKILSNDSKLFDNDLKELSLELRLFHKGIYDDQKKENDLKVQSISSAGSQRFSLHWVKYTNLSLLVFINKKQGLVKLHHFGNLTINNSLLILRIFNPLIDANDCHIDSNGLRLIKVTASSGYVTASSLVSVRDSAHGFAVLFDRTTNLACNNKGVLDIVLKAKFDGNQIISNQADPFPLSRWTTVKLGKELRQHRLHQRMVIEPPLFKLILDKLSPMQAQFNKSLQLLQATLRRTDKNRAVLRLVNLQQQELNIQLIKQNRLSIAPSLFSTELELSGIRELGSDGVTPYDKVLRFDWKKERSDGKLGEQTVLRPFQVRTFQLLLGKGQVKIDEGSSKASYQQFPNSQSISYPQLKYQISEENELIYRADSSFANSLGLQLSEKSEVQEEWMRKAGAARVIALICALIML